MENALRRRYWLSLAEKIVRILLSVGGIVLLFSLYTWDLSKNPRGFYLDESATAYNAYLVSRTGAGEFGPRFPLMFQLYTGDLANYVNPATIYLLAIVFRFLPPSIFAARAFAAFWMFAACLLLGLLAKRISGQLKIGIIVAITALLTPWFFEVGRLVWDAHFVAFTVVLFLLAAYHACRVETWAWKEVLLLAASLTLLSYGYFSGRILGPLFAIGLLLFATSWHRFVAVVKTWLVYGVTLIPIIVFNRSHPGMITKRLYEISYIKPGAPWKEIASEFVRRYLEDQSLYPLLMVGDYHPRHHVQGSGGAIFFATFILTMIGLLLVFARGGWRDPWWRFVVYGLAVSIIPGAITNEPFHELRLTGYAVFLLLLTVPALQCLLGHAQKESEDDGQERTQGVAVSCSGIPRAARLTLLALLLAGTLIQAIHFQIIYSREGPERINEFDVPYKAAYNAAVAQPQRPIYLENGQWGPAYMDAYWYATVEGRPKSEFVPLPAGARPPSGAIVLSSNSECQNCQPIQKSGCYLLYRAK